MTLSTPRLAYLRVKKEFPNVKAIACNEYDDFYTFFLTSDSNKNTNIVSNTVIAVQKEGDGDLMCVSMFDIPEELECRVVDLKEL